MDSLLELVRTPGLALYEIVSNSSPSNLRRIIASAPQTRAICNNPRIAGTRYTDSLRHVCSEIFRHFDFGIQEEETVVINILRGALNFGLRDALSASYGWYRHNTSFLSAQREREKGDSESWHITENGYQKIYFPAKTSIVMGDVVATGTSLGYGLDTIINTARRQGCSLKNFIFFTYGGEMAERIFSGIDSACRESFPDYRNTYVVYLEGRFTVPDLATPLSIKLTGTDLLRYHALMAPEFIESQYEDPAYPLERCTIYDAGSRAFWIPEYAHDVADYWKQTLSLAENGMSFIDLLAERFPGLDAGRFPETDLGLLCRRQISEMETLFLNRG